MKYVIYIGVAALVVWAAVYLIRHLRRQLKGDCACGCDQCANTGCSRRKP